MSAVHENRIVEKALPLVFAGGLAVFTLGAVAFSQWTGAGQLHSSVQDSRIAGQVRVALGEDNALSILAWPDGTPVGHYEPGPNQFGAGALRSLSRITGAELMPVRDLQIVWYRGGAVFLRDVETGEQISLNAFDRAEALRIVERLDALNQKAEVSQ